GVYGSPRFYMAAKKIGLKAHIGAEGTAKPGHGLAQNPTHPYRLPLLVSTRAGYQNLCRLITRMKLRAAKGEGAVTEEELRQHAEGLICLTGDHDGPLASALKTGGIDAARNSVARLTEIFGPNHVYVEL